MTRLKRFMCRIGSHRWVTRGPNGWAMRLFGWRFCDRGCGARQRGYDLRVVEA